MKYVNADNILPKELISLIQEHIDGEYLYIPRKSDNQKSWGELNGTREIIKKRNREIYEKYISGIAIEALVSCYFLSEKSIRRIITEQKRISFSNSLQSHCID